MDNCIFCKIMKGEIPCNKIYEDKFTFAFLDINPVNIGHTLVIPKSHSPTFLEMPLKDSEKIMKTINKIAPAILSVLGTSAFNLVQSNGKAADQAINHVHFHIIPRYENDNKDIKWKTEQALPGELNTISEKIKQELSKLKN